MTDSELPGFEPEQPTPAPAPTTPVPDLASVKVTVEEALTDALAQLTTGSRAAVSKIAALSASAAEAAATGDTTSLESLGRQVKLTAERERIRLVGIQWDAFHKIVIGITKTLVAAIP